MSAPRAPAAVVIVVPDGLAAEGRPLRAVARPSFAFRAVLDHVVANHGAKRILIAPANDFGSGASEQQVAADYLAERRVSGAVLAPPSEGRGYIDTRGNAALLRRHLEHSGEWPLAPIVLVAARPHARRARVCFQKEGYEVARLEPVPFTAPHGESIVTRLWYYRDPRLHALYEGLALVRDLLRPARSGQNP